MTEPNGLIYMRARYYSPALRRFINADIIPGEISNAITLNRYAYANGNPTMMVDPTGLFVGVLIFTVLLAGVAVGATASSSSKVTESSSNAKQSSNRHDRTKSSQTPPKITSVKQAEELYLSGQISEEDVPAEYSWEPSIRAQYEEEQKKSKKEKTNNPQKMN